ncbi:S-methyl-5-thioribose-1-phosphate isomerase [Planctomyces bekefii]|uniref:Methylthioribose-1-phosphate isomerase n=1 Tax=Planctomyces bekefii TaxID=1653850 RepID=A0A5C6MBQ1_9PLAN|nr:S-methyl-5-thioribose-1-phosphate isomerase [Planctomyces bekefii]
MIAAMRYENHVLHLLDQRQLPVVETWLALNNLESIAQAIETMVVRGAPAIGCAAAFALAIDVQGFADADSFGGYLPQFHRSIQRLGQTRPTAVNLRYALAAFEDLAKTFESKTPIKEVRLAMEDLANSLFADDLATCHAIGRHGAALALGQRISVITHCNAGALATAGYGTALGVIRAMHAAGHISVVYVDETRPYLQGARLTAYELEKEGIPYQLITDSTAAYLMQQNRVDLAIVGADRIARNGDTANKIGTYGLAIQCHYHGVPMFVAAPWSTFDLDLEHGTQIPIEERHPDEVRWIGKERVAPASAPVYNPSFDVTPAPFLSGFVTEHGVLRPPLKAAIATMSNGKGAER